MVHLFSYWTLVIIQEILHIWTRVCLTAESEKRSCLYSPFQTLPLQLAMHSKKCSIRFVTINVLLHSSVWRRLLLPTMSTQMLLNTLTIIYRDRAQKRETVRLDPFYKLRLEHLINCKIEKVNVLTSDDNPFQIYLI